jgi:hypothetical protein
MTLKAKLYNNDIKLEWGNIDEAISELHSIERSLDREQFHCIASKEATENEEETFANDWLDESPQPGDYYYRIRYKKMNGTAGYSNMVKVNKPAYTEVPAVFSNPVRNGQIRLKMGKLAEGMYQVKLINSIGQLIYTGRINHQNRYFTETIILKNTSHKGLCKLALFSKNNTQTTLDVLLQ